MISPHIRIYESFSKIPENYRNFLREAGRSNFFISLDWFENLAINAIESDTELRIYGLEEDSRVLVVLVIRSPRSIQGSLLGQYRFYARTLSSFTNFQSCEFLPVIDPSVKNHQKLLSYLFKYILDEKPTWDLIEINSMPIEGEIFAATQAAMIDAGFITQKRPHFGNRYEIFNVTDFDAYLSQRNASDRKQLQNYARKRRKLEKDHRLNLRIVAGEVEDIEQLVEDYALIHAASWKETESFEHFMPNLLRVAARSGLLRMGILYIDGTPVATEVGLLSNKRATMIKTSYDTRFREFSVGAIIMLEMIKHLIEVDHVQEIDFGRNDEPYKQLWMPLRRMRWGILACNPRTAKGLLMLVRIFGQRVFNQVLIEAKRRLKPMWSRS